MNEEQYKALVAKIGLEAAADIKARWDTAESKMKEIAAEAVKQGGITEARFKEYETTAKTAIDEVKELARKQGLTLEDLTQKLATTSTSAIKSIAEVLAESDAEFKRIKQQGVGVKEFMVHAKADGTFVMRPLADTNKAAGVTGTVDGLSGGGSTSSIAQSLDAATLLRIGGTSPLFSQYRNTQWLFDLVNVTTAGWDMPFAMWFEEVAKQGTSTVVAEGATKPTVQYAYTLKSQAYKKEAQLINITEEFSLDFARLQSDIMGKGRIDVLNAVNAVILTDLIAAATAYNTGASFVNATPVANANDFDALAAMAAQVDAATFGNQANSAIMSTFKKYRMGINKSTTNEYVDRPAVLDNLSFIGNPAMAADDVIVGDLKQFNVILRGGFIVRVGYNGTDFAENKFSVVMEQYFYDYISNIRKVAIVKGPDFATVRAAIS